MLLIMFCFKSYIFDNKDASVILLVCQFAMINKQSLALSND